jgi:F-type H+-transporting ATPase subunit gamma
MPQGRVVPVAKVVLAMSKLHEIREHIESVKNTQKVTRAMHLISSSKVRHAKEHLTATLPYFEEIASTLSEIIAVDAHAGTYYLEERTGDWDQLYIVLGGDKGMAGGYNHNIRNLVRDKVDKEHSRLLVAGIVGRLQFIRDGYDVDSDFTYAVMNPNLHRAREIAQTVVEAFLSQQYKKVNIIYTSVVSPIKQVPVVAQLLPLHPGEFAEVVGAAPEARDYHNLEYKPSAHDVFDHLVPHYLTGVIYAAFVEAYASELYARIFAMDNATKSAEEMLGNLNIRFNRERQAQITQEISEIVSGSL